MAIYVSGATGRLGSSFMKLVPSAIPLVRGKSRLKKQKVTDFSVSQLGKILKNAEAVVHLAGSVKTYDSKDLYGSNVWLTENIVEASPPSARIIFASSISVYGKELAELPADENAECLPDSHYAKSKLLAEKAVMKKQNYVILRIGTVYGPQFSDYFRFLRLLQKKRMPLIGDGSNRVPFVHVEDACLALKAAIGKGRGIYNIVGEEKTQKEVYRIACDLLSVPEPRSSVPLGAAMTFAGASEFFAGITGKKPAITREHVAVLGYDRAFDCSRARKDLGFKPRPLEGGIVDVVRAFKKHYKL